MTKQTERKQTIECFLVIFLILALFFAVILIVGYLSGTNWLTSLAQLTKGMSLSIINLLA